MRRIDQQTVQRILDTADIVEVVSDFVSLKRRGTGYIGLCPFHNERTPSFSVSKAKNICKCFSCGQGGSPVNFIMLHEQMSYYEALLYLAKKYGIEVKEREMTEEERKAEGERESLMAINEFALGFFRHTLTDTADGRNVGLAYFRERGINDAMIERFKLGYSPEERDALSREALAKGYSKEYLVKAGLSVERDHGELRDRFRARVIYPVFSVSGKVVAFGGRTLRKDKDVAKYVNSPESVVYSKSRELYGLYQAKRAITAKDKCLLVEGYMDVISLHQSGVENVVASSGTSLTEGQIRLIHRFTDNVTLVYDSDPAGIKASLRGIGMLLAEGLNISVLLLPEGEDPDSFAQHHSSSEVEKYLAENETDFIRFMTTILLKDAQGDPIKRAKVIAEIVRTIAVIPDDITRTVYTGECSRMLEIDENVLTLQVARERAERAHRNAENEARRRGAESLAPPAQGNAGADRPEQPAPAGAVNQGPGNLTEAQREERTYLLPAERELMRYVVKYGAAQLAEVDDGQGGRQGIRVLDYIDAMLADDEITLTDAAMAKVYDASMALLHGSWEQDLAERTARQAETDREAMAEGIARIRETAHDMAAIERAERELDERIAADSAAAIDEYACNYIERALESDPDDVTRRVATELAAERHQLSKIHTKFAHVETERERLTVLVPRAVAELKYATVELRLHQCRKGMMAAQQRNNPDEIIAAMRGMQELNQIKMELARFLGERILSPRK